jgi:hypothetical protein
MSESSRVADRWSVHGFRMQRLRDMLLDSATCYITTRQWLHQEHNPLQPFRIEAAVRDVVHELKMEGLHESFERQQKVTRRHRPHRDQCAVRARGTHICRSWRTSLGCLSATRRRAYSAYSAFGGASRAAAAAAWPFACSVARRVSMQTHARRWPNTLRARRAPQPRNPAVAEYGGEQCVEVPAATRATTAHRRMRWAHPGHICTGTALTAATSAPAMGSPLPHLHRDCAHGCHICAGNGLAAATSAPGLGLAAAASAPGLASPGPHLHWDSACSATP